MILGVIDGATIRRSLAEILSGPVAFPASKFENSFKDLSFRDLREVEIVEQEAWFLVLVDDVGVIGGVLRWSTYETVRLKYTLWYTLIESEAKLDLNHSCHSCSGIEYITNVNADLCQIEPGVPVNTVTPKHYSLVNSVCVSEWTTHGLVRLTCRCIHAHIQHLSWCMCLAHMYAASLSTH